MERHCCLIRRKHLAFLITLYDLDVTVCRLSIALSDFIELAITFYVFVRWLAVKVL